MSELRRENEAREIRLLHAIQGMRNEFAIASMDSKKALAGQQLSTIRNYLLVKKAPHELRTRINSFYEYLWGSMQNIKYTDISVPEGCKLVVKDHSLAILKIGGKMRRQ